MAPREARNGTPPPAPAAPKPQRVAMPEPPPWIDEAPPAEVEEAAPVAAPAQPAAPVALQTTALGDRWAAKVAELNERQALVALVRELAMQAELVDAPDSGPWRLRVERESLRTDALRDKLQAALGGQAIALEAGAAQDSPARREAAERQRLQQQAEATINNDPLVRDLMAQFSTARIVPGSIKPTSSAAGERR
jgi:DNA polymerase-3 subunit gamma/tau